MALPKCERVYFASIGISIVWGVIQAILSRNNWALLLIGVMSVLIGLYGFWKELCGNPVKCTETWIAWYLLPLTILLLGHVGIFYDFHDIALITTGHGKMARPVPEADYAAEFVSYLLSMAIVPLGLGMSTFARSRKWC